MSKLHETPVQVIFVMDGSSPRPRIRIEVGTWSTMEIMPPEIFFKLCAEWYSNRNDE